MENSREVYEIEYESDFRKNFKRFTKKKRFDKLPDQIEELVSELRNGHFTGTVLKRSDEPVRYEIYKKRLPNLNTNEGKSNGYRVIYLTQHDEKYVIFITIYYKPEQETVSDAYIEGWIDCLFADK